MLLTDVMKISLIGRTRNRTHDKCCIMMMGKIDDYDAGDEDDGDW